MGHKIFELEQIARAAELGLGVTEPGGIDIIAGDEENRRYAESVRSILLKG